MGSRAPVVSSSASQVYFAGCRQRPFLQLSRGAEQVHAGALVFEVGILKKQIAFVGLHLGVGQFVQVAVLASMRVCAASRLDCASSYSSFATSRAASSCSAARCSFRVSSETLSRVASACFFP